MRWFISLICLGFSSWTVSGAEPRFRISGDQLFVLNLDKEQLKKAAAWKVDAPEWATLVRVIVAPDKGQDLAKRELVRGEWKTSPEGLIFRPRFPFLVGVSYILQVKIPEGQKSAPPWETIAFALAEGPKQPPTEVQAIYPSADELPENQLKFYIHFTAPMGRGQAYEQIVLLDEKQKPIQAAFFELVEELWDFDAKRFTLIVDPGRIKQGLKPREDLGPVFEKGKRYTLVVRSTWQDAEGRPLKKEFRKAFSVGAAQEKEPDPKTWKITPPESTNPAEAGSRVRLRFPTPMDQALLMRLITVQNAQGKEVAGKVVTRENEKVWEFQPKETWQPGNYKVRVDTILEDLAGNAPGRPFEVDVFRKIEKQIVSRYIEFPFKIAPND